VTAIADGDFMMCERCKKEVHFVEKDMFCDRTICINCTKSSKKPEKTKHVVICKDCWSNLPKRGKFKSM